MFYLLKLLHPNNKHILESLWCYLKFWWLLGATSCLPDTFSLFCINSKNTAACQCEFKLGKYSAALKHISSLQQMYYGLSIARCSNISRSHHRVIKTKEAAWQQTWPCLGHLNSDDNSSLQEPSMVDTPFTEKMPEIAILSSF